MSNFSALSVMFSKLKEIIQQDDPESTLLEKSAKLSKFSIPSSDEDWSKFAEKCLASLKQKADILSKSYNFQLNRAGMLDLTSNLFFFEDWQEAQLACKNIPKQSQHIRLSSGEAFKLSLTLISVSQENLSNSGMMNSLLEAVISAAAMSLNFKFKIDHQIAAEIFFKAVTKKQSNTKENSALTADEMIFIVKDYHGYDEKYLLSHMLNYSMTHDGKRTPWPPLKSLSVAETLLYPFAQNSSNLGFGLQGITHLSILILSIVDKYSELAIPMLYGFDQKAALQEKQRLRKGLDAQETRDQAMIAAKQILKPYLKSSVLEAFTKKPMSNGLFFADQATPSELKECFITYEADYDEDECEAEPRDNTLTYCEEIQPGIFLSVFRQKIETEEEGVILFNVSAYLHNHADELIAVCSLDHLTSDGYELHPLAMAADQVGRTATKECILTLGTSNNELDYEDYMDYVTVVENWEVTAELQGNGYGRIVFDAAFEIGLEDMEPSLVMARIFPHKFPVPIPDSNITPAFEEIDSEIKKLRRIWSSVTESSSSFGGTDAVFFEGTYQKILHGSHNYADLFLAFFMRKQMGE